MCATGIEEKKLYWEDKRIGPFKDYLLFVFWSRGFGNADTIIKIPTENIN